MLIAAFAAVAIASVKRGAAPLAVMSLAALVPAGALAGSARLAADRPLDLVREAGHEVELVGYVIRREPVSYGVRRVRLEATAYRLGTGAAWTPVEERVQVRSRGAAVGRVSVGDELRGTGRLALPSSAGDRFDYAAHLRRAGVHTVLHADRVAATGRRRAGLNATLDAVRRGRSGA